MKKKNAKYNSLWLSLLICSVFLSGCKLKKYTLETEKDSNDGCMEVIDSEIYDSKDSDSEFGDSEFGDSELSDSETNDMEIEDIDQIEENNSDWLCKTHIPEVKFFFSNSNISKFDHFIKDEKNIPMAEHNGVNYYNPVTISQYGAHLFSHYLETQNDETIQVFFNNADWLVNNLTKKEGVWAYEYPIDYPYFWATAPWISAMAQGLALTVLYQAYYLSKDTEYLNVAEKILTSFDYNVEEGGVTRIIDEKYLWYEEYAGEHPSLVLNGKIFALAAIHYYAALTKSSKASDIYKKGEEALIYMLENYDRKYWSFYDNRIGGGTIAKSEYHMIHIDQLIFMCSITQNTKYIEMAEQFLKYVFGNFEQRGIDIKTIVDAKVSHSINPEEFGPENMINGTWTYGKYWSTNKFPANITIDLKNNREEIQSIIVVFATEPDINNNSLSLEYSNDSISWHEAIDKSFNWQPYISEMIEISGSGATKTFPTVFKIPDSIHSARYIRITFHSYPKILAIREIGVHFDRTSDLIRIAESIGLEISYKNK